MIFRLIGLLIVFGVAPIAVLAQECVKVETTVKGNSLQGKLWPDQAITVYGWGCGTPARYDYIVFDLEGRTEQVIKQLWGLPGDELVLLDNGRFTINGTEAKTPFGKPYVLLGYSRTRFKAISGTLDGYLVLGHPGSRDSAQVGLLKKWDILGYVPQQEAEQSGKGR